VRPLDWTEIVRLRDKEGLTFEQIAERLGKTKGAVYNAYRRAKAGKLGSKPKREAGKPESLPKEDLTESKLLSKPTPIVGLPQGLLPDLQEIVSWWRKRKEERSKPVVYSPTKRVTYILSEDLIRKVREYAQKKGITITEAINEIIRRGLEVG